MGEMKGRSVSDSEIGDTPVVIVLNSDFQMSSQGGVENYVKDLTHVLRERGLNIHLAGILSDGRKETEGEFAVARKKVSNYSFLFHLVRLAFKLRRRGRIIVNTQRPDHLVPFLLLSKRKRVLICTIHGPQRKAILENKGRIVSRIYNALEVIGFRAADVVVFTDSRTLTWYLAYLPWLNDKSTTIPPGVSSTFLHRIPRDEAMAELGFTKAERIFSFVGRLEHEKNVDLIIKAFSKVSERHDMAKLAIAGDGSLRMELEALVRALRMQTKVMFLGQVDREHVKYLLMSSDAMILVSKWEGSPLVLREALASGALVICADIGDARQIVRDETCGFIVGEPTEETLAEAMERAYSRDGARVNENYGAEFRWDRIANRFIVLFGQTLRGVRPDP